jgi:hypothetical protein
MKNLRYQFNMHCTKISTKLDNNNKTQKKFSFISVYEKSHYYRKIKFQVNTQYVVNKIYFNHCTVQWYY